MKRRTASSIFQPIGPTDIWISPFPKQPVEEEDIPFLGTPLNELPQELGAHALQMLKPAEQRNIALKDISGKGHLTTILAQMREHAPTNYKEGWVEFVLRQCCTHFCTLTFSRNLTKNKPLAYKLVQEFSKRLNRFLLGRNFSKSSKRERSALVIAFSDAGSDEKTRRKLQRSINSPQVKRRIRFGDDHALHFHLLIRLTKEHLNTFEKKCLNIPSLIQREWLDIGQTFAARANGTEYTANYCGSSLIEPIEDPLAVVLYCLKNFQQPLPVGAHQVTPPNSPSDPTTQRITTDMAS